MQCSQQVFEKPPTKDCSPPKDLLEALGSSTYYVIKSAGGGGVQSLLTINDRGVQGNNEVNNFFEVTLSKIG